MDEYGSDGEFDALEIDDSPIAGLSSKGPHCHGRLENAPPNIFPDRSWDSHSCPFCRSWSAHSQSRTAVGSGLPVFQLAPARRQAEISECPLRGMISHPGSGDSMVTLRVDPEASGQVMLLVESAGSQRRHTMAFEGSVSSGKYATFLAQVLQEAQC
jgi:hypothetical protein